jgi:hypothetical protein
VSLVHAHTETTLLDRPQGTVILALPIWFACQLSIRDRLKPEDSSPVSLSYPIRFSLSIGTFGFSAGWILLFPPFSLLISTFSLLIALSDSPCGADLKSYRLHFPLYRTFYYRPLPSFESQELTASVSDLVSCISGASFLVLYVVTRFFTDGCFQAHRQVVIGHSLPFALSLKFETLSVDLGCFPLNVQYFSTAVGLRSICFQVYSQFAPNRYTLTCPHWYRALPPWDSNGHCLNSFRRKQAIT